ncbi:MAG: hypothetical protein LBL24_05725, partial [Bacteroidales bacterium]|nr:hypothetical protein [Bacteroidales bacterium]
MNALTGKLRGLYPVFFISKPLASFIMECLDKIITFGKNLISYFCQTNQTIITMKNLFLTLTFTGLFVFNIAAQQKYAANW